LDDLFGLVLNPHCKGHGDELDFDALPDNSTTLIPKALQYRHLYIFDRFLLEETAPSLLAVFKTFRQIRKNLSGACGREKHFS